MVRKRVSDKEEILELRKENDQLRKEIAILPKTKPNDLTPREKAILDYIDRNPGRSKEAVIERLTEESKGSRITIRKAIENLERYGMIHARKDKPNSQIYKLYINEDSIFLTLYRELENFKNAFFILIDRIITKFIKDNETLQTSISEDSDLLYDLLLIYHHILGIYLTYSILKWSTEVNDESILTKIYAIIIYRMVEIQQKLSEAFRIKGRMPSFDRATVGDVFNPILQEFIHRMFLLEPSAIIKILDDYKKYNLDYEVLPLVAIAWEIGFPIYPYTDLTIELLPEDRNKLKDWRHAVAYYLFKNKNKIQVSDEIWNMLGSPPNSD